MNIDGQWKTTMTALPDTRQIRIEATCEPLNLRAQFDVSNLEALHFAVGILKTYVAMDPAIAADLFAHLQSYEKHVSERAP